MSILCNKWIIEFLISPDRNIETSLYVSIIWVFQFSAISIGTYFVIKKPTFRMPTKAEFALLSTSIVITVLLFEAGCRIWLNSFATPEQRYRYILYTDIDPVDWEFTPHHYLNYYSTPNYRHGLTFHNSLGYRDDEFPIEKPGGIYRIVVLGGSTVYTLAVEDNKETFTSKLEIVLQNEYGYNNVEVINAGVPGYNSWESLINFQFRVLDLSPDLIIIYHGTNDIHTRLVPPETYRGDNSGRRKQWSPPSVSLLGRSYFLRIVRRRLGYFGQVNLGSLVNVERPTLGSIDMMELLKANPPVFFRRNLTSMIAIAKANDIDVILATWVYSPHFDRPAAIAYYHQGVKENNKVVKEVADSRNVPLFDFAAVMKKDKKYWNDGHHVNKEGAFLKAQLFAEFIHNSGFIQQTI